MVYTYDQTFNFTDNKAVARYLDMGPYATFVEPVPCVNCVTFFAPFISSDVFHFQFNEDILGVQFFKPGASPEEELDAGGSVVIDGKGFTIDFSKIDSNLNCFYIKINGDCRLQHGYIRMDPSACARDTFLLESSYSGVDPLGNDYSEGYSNRMRFFGTWEWTSSETETEEDSEGKVQREEFNRVYTIRFEEIMNNSWILTNLVESILRGNNLTLETTDGDVITFQKFAESIDKNNELNSDWVIELELRTQSVVLNSNC